MSSIVQIILLLEFPLIYSDRIKIQNNQALSMKMNNKLKLKLVIGSTNIIEQEIDNPVRMSIHKIARLLLYSLFLFPYFRLLTV